MLRKVVMAMLLVQGVVFADEVKLQGVDTVEVMRIDTSSKSATYLISVYYEQSKVDSEVLLDLYWAMECSQYVDGLDSFASKQSDKKFVTLKKSYRDDKKAYQQSIREFHNAHCKSSEDILVSRAD